MINIGIVGIGYWGPNYIRTLNELKENIVCCCDLDTENLDKMKNLYSDINITTNYLEMVNDPKIDAVVIATPLNTHFNITKDFLINGKHVLVEKPFTATTTEAMELTKIAKKKNVILMVGHTYIYNPGVKKLKEIMVNKLGKLYYIRAERLGLGPIRKNANALWDLCTHDISIATFLLDAMPESVSADGACYIQKDIEDMVFLTLKFANNMLYNIYASWIAPEKIRKTTVVGSDAMVIFDDVNKAEMIKMYDRKINKTLLDSTPEYSDHQSIVSFGDIYIPNIEQSEPLKNQLKHFLDCISHNKEPITNGCDGLKIVKILEAAERSLDNKGVETKIL